MDRAGKLGCYAFALRTFNFLFISGLLFFMEKNSRLFVARVTIVRCLNFLLQCIMQY